MMTLFCNVFLVSGFAFSNYIIAELFSFCYFNYGCVSASLYLRWCWCFIYSFSFAQIREYCKVVLWRDASMFTHINYLARMRSEEHRSDFSKSQKIFLLYIRNNYDNWKAIESLDQTWDTLKLFDLQNRALLASVLFKNGILFDCFGPLRKNPFKIFRRLCEVMLITHLRFSLIIIGHHMAARIKSDKST